MLVHLSCVVSVDCVRGLSHRQPLLTADSPPTLCGFFCLCICFWYCVVRVLRPSFCCRLQFLEKVRFQTEYMDTVVLHNKPQRFKTKDLERQLHKYYFTSIVRDIATRAEAVAVERQIRDQSEQLTTNLHLSKVKQHQLKRLKTKFARSERMRLKRSALHQQMFGKFRRHILVRVMTAWKAFIKWRRTVRNNFHVQFQVRVCKRVFASPCACEFTFLLVLCSLVCVRVPCRMQVKHNDLTIRKKERQRRDMVEHALHGLTKRDNHAAQRLSTEDRIYTAGGIMGREVPHVARTIMQSHNRRHARCRNCRQEYTPLANHAHACAYHPGVYEMACPKSCPRFSNACMGHYKRRWSCCDVTVEIPHEAGCHKRWHEPDHEPYLEGLVKAAHDNTNKRHAAMAARVAEADKWTDDARLTGKAQLNKIIKDTAAARVEANLLTMLN